MNSGTAKIAFGILWFGGGMLYARLFMRSIRSFTDKMQPESGTKIILHLVLGGLVRLGLMAALLYFALQMGPLYAILAVAGFTVINLFQVSKLSGKRADTKKDKDKEVEK